MALSINNNLSALISQNNLNKNNALMNTTMQRLSTGLRLNSAKDDAAGLAISTLINSQISGLEQASRNASDAISMSQTAEGALTGISEGLQRVRELSVQAANGSNSDVDRNAIQSEINQLIDQVEEIANNTQFNGIDLLTGELNDISFQVGADATQSVSLSIAVATPQSLGDNTVSSDGTLSHAALGTTTNHTASQTVTVSGYEGSADIHVNAGDSSAQITSNINAQSAKTGVTAQASTSVTLTSISGLGATTSGTVNFTLTGGAGSTNISATLSDVTNFSELAQAINSSTASTGISAISENGTLTLSNETGADISISDFNVSDVAGNQSISFSGDSGIAVNVTEGGPNDTAVASGNVTLSSPDSFTLTTDTAGSVFSSDTTSSQLNNVASIDASTASGANDAIRVIDAAIQSVANARSDLGAFQNRLESTINNLSTTSENLSRASSQIRDTDYAKSVADLLKQQLLDKSSIAMQAQGNAQASTVLALLGGA